MQGLSLDPKDYEARKLDKVKDAFKCPDGLAIPIVFWDNWDKTVDFGAFDETPDAAWHNYATFPGYEIPEEWRTYKEPEKPRRMTRAEARRAQLTCALEFVYGDKHSSKSISCDDDICNEPIGVTWECRPWGTTEWLEPTIDLLPKEWGVK